MTKTEAKCTCEYAEHTLHDRLRGLEKDLDAVLLAFEMVDTDYGMTVEEFHFFVDAHNWGDPKRVHELVVAVEHLERIQHRAWAVRVAS